MTSQTAPEQIVPPAEGKIKATTNNRLVYERIRRDIIAGTLPPGMKLNVARCCTIHGVSPGAVREALAVLEAEGLVSSEPQRGYQVSQISSNDLSQLLKARIEIENLCVAEAIQHGDLAWEGMIVAAFHRLSRISQQSNGPSVQQSTDWTTAHADFHKAVVAGCENPWLLRIHTMLYQQSERYRLHSVPLAMAGRDVLGEHKAILDAVLLRDVGAAQKCMTSHLQATADLLLASPFLENA